MQRQRDADGETHMRPRAAVGGFETERDDLTDNQGELPIKLPRKEFTVVK